MTKRVVELLTNEQLVEAVAEWLFKAGRVPEGIYEEMLVTVMPNGCHKFTATIRETDDSRAASTV